MGGNALSARSGGFSLIEGEDVSAPRWREEDRAWRSVASEANTGWTIEELENMFGLNQDGTPR